MIHIKCSVCGLLNPPQSHVELFHKPRPVDCRTCMNHRVCGWDSRAAAECTNADRYEPLPPVRLWRVAP